ncbi:hypothetical protein PIB30_022177 [Stylosanthes scabra]|uniref:Uncharacterized protein n=1 Tax=Stylosanthes scabra TaxID=79078 RepID=A0ABU6W8Q6_9FABA|nr:hypothetical protein [Stylosanthes scabra]
MPPFNEIKGISLYFLFILLPSSKERWSRRRNGILRCDYATSTSNPRNFHTGASIDALFAAIRSSFLPLHFYVNIVECFSLSKSQKSPPITMNFGEPEEVVPAASLSRSVQNFLSFENKDFVVEEPEPVMNVRRYRAVARSMMSSELTFPRAVAQMSRAMAWCKQNPPEVLPRIFAGARGDRAVSGVFCHL